MAVPRSGWGHSGHWRAVIVGSLAILVIVGGGVAAWAEVSGGSTGYRMATVTRANIGTKLAVVGSVDPVSAASASFQVGGQVASLWVAPGQQVTAGETLSTLNTTALSESVSSAESSLNADEAKLAEDEANQTGSTGNSNGSGSPNAGASTPQQSTTTTSPSHGGTPGGTGTGTGSQSAQITQDQATLTQDESTLSNEQQKEAADLTQAQNDCTAAKTGTPTGQAACEAALQTVSADEQLVSKDQQQVSKDETALAQALAAASGGGSGSPTQGSPRTANDVADFTGNTGAGSTGNTGSGSGGTGGSSSGSGSPSGSAGTGGSSTNTDTPQQIASDQAAIDTAQANLTEARQSLKEATLTSPISGTVVSVGINVGNTVSANSSTEMISIIGTKSYEVQATLDSSQIPLVKTGQSASVEVDGLDGNLEGTVSQVGPVQSTSSGYSYPVIVSLPDTNGSNIYSGSTASVNISTGEVSNVVAVPTSAVQSLGNNSYVLELDRGQLTRKVIRVGMIGNTYTQVLSGLTPGQSVVLVDYSEAVPSSNSNTTAGLGNFLGGGSGGFPGGGISFNRGAAGTVRIAPGG
ncbi:MAG TPA: efflux RND transporter periplasmic adaptor subunit [Acidimicrobiales bacterium]|nr:efflux RND transporter periplasmic adaptor subunit [Acidimicrobiales bacterium]